MEEKEQQAKEDRRKHTVRRKTSDRRTSNILDYEILNLSRPDKRSGLDIRSGKDRRNK